VAAQLTTQAFACQRGIDDTSKMGNEKAKIIFVRYLRASPKGEAEG